MPVSQYEKYAQEFTPVKFDAKAWVRMAREAGMKYIVITSKHHDGFGMFRSDLTDWCIRSTPFQLDPLENVPNIGYWTDARAWVGWQFKITNPARFDVVAAVATAAAGGQCEVILADQKLTAEIPDTGGYQKFQRIALGQLEIKQPGTYSLTIKPVAGQWQAMNIRSIVLKPLE